MLFARKASRNARIISQHYLLICFALMTHKLAWVLGELKLVFFRWLQRINLSVWYFVSSWTQASNIFSGISYMSSRILHGASKYVQNRSKQNYSLRGEEVMLSWAGTSPQPPSLHFMRKLKMDSVPTWPLSIVNTSFLKTQLKTTTVLKESLMFYNY